MPVVNVENSGKGRNKGSCQLLVNYLEKENEGKEFDQKEHFFTHNEAMVSPGKVQYDIDHNIKKLGRDDSKFFMVTLNFSQKELKYLNNDSEKIKMYTKSFMELYASNFNKGLTSANLVWFAKVEQNRHFKATDAGVKADPSLLGKKKPGLNTHVHIIVSRRDKEQRFKLSPMTNHRDTKSGAVKGGFQRKQLKIDAERLFDDMFNYPRLMKDTFEYANTMDKGNREDKFLMRQNADTPVKEYNQDSRLESIASAISIIGNEIAYASPSENFAGRRKKKKKESDRDPDISM